MIVLVLGGTRSGKSEVAEAIAESLGSAVTYVATAAVDPDDTDHSARVAAHKVRRPPGWDTVECEAPADLPRLLREIDHPVVVDSLGTWVTLHAELTVDADDLLAALADRTASAVIVSEEVGMAVHPPSELGRRYVDAMGKLNQQVAEVADRVLLVVAGRPLELPFADGR
ncbi:bifunctional adenosylcobinamide kinase/adenosylcobinamide-phosphate guanylyltransferase [Candidatus Poriferisocius sp.]|uniref:bifunctional adenosylcobinamide kinase/adenosylcobinamide-phosphate guanylyltransferase n=1 Tax=Candidatus Poriferisocius sp. TaxID=3101276 RepID=UPI003B5B8D07